MKETTHFGFKEVPVDEKTYRVREVFDSVAQTLRSDERSDVSGAAPAVETSRH